jgi:hypothetical protein
VPSSHGGSHRFESYSAHHFPNFRGPQAVTVRWRKARTGDRGGNFGCNLIGHHGSRIGAGTREALDVALLVDGLAVFVGKQIRRQIYGLVAQYAGYFWERVTTHKCLLWTVTSSVVENGNAGWSLLTNLGIVPSGPRRLVSAS